MDNGLRILGSNPSGGKDCEHQDFKIGRLYRVTLLQIVGGDTLNTGIG